MQLVRDANERVQKPYDDFLKYILDEPLYNFEDDDVRIDREADFQTIRQHVDQCCWSAHCDI